MSDVVGVTGASGFIGSHIVRELLEGGTRVLGTVRRPSEVAHLTALPGAPDRLELATADLLDEDAFDDLVVRCDSVIHTAGPYTLDVKDPVRDLVEPFVAGTLNVLRAGRESGRVKRVVLTSSMAAITDEPDPKHVYTEKDWNVRSSLKRNPYYFAKVSAERAAWEFMKREGRDAFELVAINPFLVIGPSMIPALNTSSRIFAELLNGNYPGLMDFAWGMVDVRDVATAHVRALEAEGASGRYLCAAETVTMRELVRLLDQHGYEASARIKFNLTGPVGGFAVKLASWLRPRGTGAYLRSHVGRIPRFDNGKIRRELGVEFRPVERSILDTMESLEHWGHVPRRTSPAQSA
jgi:dihydroflavonol-4-reductase